MPSVEPQVKRRMKSEWQYLGALLIGANLFKRHAGRLEDVAWDGADEADVLLRVADGVVLCTHFRCRPPWTRAGRPRTIVSSANGHVAEGRVLQQWHVQKVSMMMPETMAVITTTTRKLYSTLNNQPTQTSLPLGSGPSSSNFGASRKP